LEGSVSHGAVAIEMVESCVRIGLERTAKALHMLARMFRRVPLAEKQA
jgi:hypothetical protein